MQNKTDLSKSFKLLFLFFFLLLETIKDLKITFFMFYTVKIFYFQFTYLQQKPVRTSNKTVMSVPNK